MNSISARFVKQFLAFLLITSAYGSQSMAEVTNAEMINSENLQANIEQLVLAQWLSLGQRADTESKVKISGLPSAYKSQPCPPGLEIESYKQLTLGRNSIQVSCPNTSSWSLMLTAEIEGWRKVVVIRDHLARGERIQGHSLTLQKRDIATLQRGYFTRLSDVSGNISKRSLKAGTALSPSMINLPIIIQRGQAVTVRVEHPGLAVNMNGIALKKGRRGDLIKVKNSSSNKVLFGRVISSDLVLVD